jgi:hypothetical protein
VMTTLIQRIPCLKSWNNVWLSTFRNYCYSHYYLYYCASGSINVLGRIFKSGAPLVVVAVQLLLPLLHCCCCFLAKLFLLHYCCCCSCYAVLLGI